MKRQYFIVQGRQDNKTKRQRDKETKKWKDKNTTRQIEKKHRPKTEFDIAMSADREFCTLAMFSGNCNNGAILFQWMQLYNCKIKCI